MSFTFFIITMMKVKKNTKIIFIFIFPELLYSTPTFFKKLLLLFFILATLSFHVFKSFFSIALLIKELLFREANVTCGNSCRWWEVAIIYVSEGLKYIHIISFIY